MQLSSPLITLLGGVAIGLASVLLMLSHGRIAGISGIWAGAVLRPMEAGGFRVFFVLGLLGGGVLMSVIAKSTFAPSPVGTAGVILAGLLVGFGTQLGSGCTSGHGVCGIGRMSTRSIIATLTFMAAGFATVAIGRHVLGGAS